MAITGKILHKQLKAYHPLFYVHSEQELIIDDFKYLINTVGDLAPNILYIGNSSELQVMLLHVSITANILCIEDTPIDDVYRQNPKINLIILGRNTTKHDVFQELKANMYPETFLAQYSLNLLKALAQEDSLQQLIEIGYEMLGNPFSIHDINFKKIAICNNAQKRADDPVWNEFAIDGYTSVKSAGFYTSNNYMEKVKNSDLPFFWSDSYSKYPRIIGKIKIGNKHVAGLVVCAHEKSFRESDLELVHALCQAISVEMHKSQFLYYSRGLMYEDFFEDLLLGKIKDEKIINESIKVINLKLRKILYILTIDTSSFDKTNISLTYMRNELEKMLPESKAVIHNDHIVIFISSDRSLRFYQTEIENFKQFLKANKVYAGISRGFYSLKDVPEHYLQSLNALKLGILLNKDDCFYKFEEYAIYHFTDLCSGVENLKDNCHPSLLKLVAYDKECNTSYTRSLYTYIVHFKNITESANALNIHRNTMFYRLEKIDDIMDIDLNSSNIFLHLHLSFKILEFLKIDFP